LNPDGTLSSRFIESKDLLPDAFDLYPLNSLQIAAIATPIMNLMKQTANDEKKNAQNIVMNMV